MVDLNDQKTIYPSMEEMVKTLYDKHLIKLAQRQKRDEQDRQIRLKQFHDNIQARQDTYNIYKNRVSSKLLKCEILVLCLSIALFICAGMQMTVYNNKAQVLADTNAPRDELLALHVIYTKYETLQSWSFPMIIILMIWEFACIECTILPWTNLKNRRSCLTPDSLQAEAKELGQELCIDGHVITLQKEKDSVVTC